VRERFNKLQDNDLPSVVSPGQNQDENDSDNNEDEGEGRTSVEQV
jgi:hypothetical protein